MQNKNSGINAGRAASAGSLDKLSEQDRALAVRLVDARREIEVLDEFPGQLPTTLQQAYDVQEAATAQWPDDVVGWKVARLPPPDRGRFPAERLAGPVFKSTVRTVAANAETIAPIPDGGFAAIEAEFVLELGTVIPPVDKEWSDADIARHVSRACCGAEIACSSMPFVIELGAMAIIADLGINAGVIVGPEVADYAALPADAHSVRVLVDGAVVGEARPGPISDDPFQAMRFLFRHCASRGIELPAGTLVSTGLLTGVHEVRVGSVARVDFGSCGWFDVRFEALSRK